MGFVVLRITRHPLDSDREEFLKGVFGSDLRIITHDLPYGENPVQVLLAVIMQIEGSGVDTVMAIEAQAPFPVLMKLVGSARRELGVMMIRAQFERDASGRAIVVGKDASGRDLLKFSHYEELVRIEFETKPLKRRNKE